MERKHIAFRCAYNDNAGSSPYAIGYMGACSKAMTVYNVRKGAPWCSLPECPCRGYALEGTARPDYPCYESRMLVDWQAYAGFDHDGQDSWTPRRIVWAGVGSIAFLTTRYPGTTESERVIFAAFMVSKAVAHDPKKSGWVKADDRLRITLREDELVRFWEYYKNPGRPDYIGWGSGRFRYLSSDEAGGAMRALADAVRDDERKGIAMEMADIARG